MRRTISKELRRIARKTSLRREQRSTYRELKRQWKRIPRNQRNAALVAMKDAAA